MTDLCNYSSKNVENYEGYGHPDAEGSVCARVSNVRKHLKTVHEIRDHHSNAVGQIEIIGKLRLGCSNQAHYTDQAEASP